MISIVMTYFNRRRELINTLDSISKYAVDGMEVIIVDDASEVKHSIDDLPAKYAFDINLIVISKEDKKHINPCVPFNMGFRAVKNDIVIIQNAECYHVGDIIGHVIANIKDDVYLNYAAYNLSQEDTQRLTDNADEFFTSFKPNESRSEYSTTAGWFNHPKYNPICYHFCSAMTKGNLDKLNGFDERFASGVGWDDVEFLHRARLILKVISIGEPYVLHQYHYYCNPYVDIDIKQLGKQNQSLIRITRTENKHHANENSYYGHRD